MRGRFAAVAAVCCRGSLGGNLAPPTCVGRFHRSDGAREVCTHPGMESHTQWGRLPFQGGRGLARGIGLPPFSKIRFIEGRGRPPVFGLDGVCGGKQCVVPAACGVHPYNDLFVAAVPQPCVGVLEGTAVMLRWV